MLNTSRLKTLAQALASDPKTLSDALNLGLNGNKVLKTSVLNGDVVIMSRQKPEDAFVLSAFITKDGDISPVEEKTQPGKKMVSLFEKAVRTSVLAAAESRTVPSSSDMMKVLGATDFVMKDEVGLRRLGQIGINISKDKAEYAVRDVSKLVSPQMIVHRMARFNTGAITFNLIDTDIVMLDKDGKRLASLYTQGHKYGTYVNHTAKETINTVFCAAIMGLDANLDLVSIAKTARESQRKMWELQQRERAAAQEHKRIIAAQAHADSFFVPAGSTFLMSGEYDWDGGYEFQTHFKALRDLKAEDFVALMEGETEGLVETVYLHDFRNTQGALTRLKDALETLKGEKDADPAPAL